MKEFPPFRLDNANQCLWRRDQNTKDERILLTPKAFGVLRYLVEHPGRLVTHDELLDAVWPAIHVQPQAVKKLILDLRDALGDQAQNPQFIETSHRRGYRFIAAVREVGEGQSVALAPALPTRLVGREKQLTELRECLEKALRGDPQLVFITGEMGIGKTALADEAQRQAAAEVTTLRIARGQCIEGYGGKEAYYPMLEALGQLCRGPGVDSLVQTLAAHAPTWLIQFPALVTPEHREMLEREILGATRERMLREIGDALEAITSTNPLLLVFEDLQWVDYATVDLISALARRRRPAKLMLLGTKRSLDMVQEHPLRALKDELLVHQLCREIALEPLGEAEVAEYLAAESSDASLPEGLVKLVYHHSEGNPLFIVAALQHLTERGLLSRAAGAWKLRVPLQDIALEVPQKLRRMIETQILSLSREEQEALEVASVSGVSFSASLSAEIAEVDPIQFEGLCERLSRHRHIVQLAAARPVPDGTLSRQYEFAHALYREVLYRRLAIGRRTNLHLRIGERLETSYFGKHHKDASELAHHFEEGCDWARAVKYLRLAAESAKRRYANREAIIILRRALQLCTKLRESERALCEIEVLELLGMIHAGDYDLRAIESFEAMASRAADHGLVDIEARALIGLAYPLSWISSRRCLEALERALFLGDHQSDRLLRAVTRINSFFYRIWVGGWNPQDVEEYRKEFDEIQSLGDLVTRSYHLGQYSVLQWASSEYRKADRNLSEAVSSLLRSDVSNHLNLTLIYWVHQLFSSSSLLFLGEWGRAFNQFRAGIAMLDKNGDAYRANTLRLYLAWAHLQAMDFESVLKICDSAFTDPEKTALNATPDPLSPLPEEARICLILKGSAQLGLGNCDRALENLLAARNAMDQETVIIDWYWRMPLESALSEVWLSSGDLARARSQVDSFLNVTLSTQEHTWQALAWEAGARVAIAEGDSERTQDCLAKALQTIEGFEVPLAEWRVYGTLAEVYERNGDRRQADQYFELSRSTISRLANSIESDEPLQKIFLSAPSMRKISEGARLVSGQPRRHRGQQ